MTTASQKIIDCLIIGAGPAGIAAALYLLRFRRTLSLVDTDQSRALMIPTSHNYPAFKYGISGPALLHRLKAQLKSYKLPIILERVDKLELTAQGLFLANDYLLSKTVILTTGIEDIEPKLPDIDQAVKNGLVRHCPVCDAYEVINKRIGVIGHGADGLNEALFLRRYSPYITLLTQGHPIKFSAQELKKIQEAQIKIIENPIVKVDKLKNRINAFHFSEQESISFDTIYSALGCVKNNKLAFNLGAKLKNGELIVDQSQQTSIPGLYAAGDIVSGLNQICVAQGQAAIAATAINKILDIKPFK